MPVREHGFHGIDEADVEGRRGYGAPAGWLALPELQREGRYGQADSGIAASPEAQGTRAVGRGSGSGARREGLEKMKSQWNHNSQWTPTCTNCQFQMKTIQVDWDAMVP